MFKNLTLSFSKNNYKIGSRDRLEFCVFDSAEVVGLSIPLVLINWINSGLRDSTCRWANSMKPKVSSNLLISMIIYGLMTAIRDGSPGLPF